METRWKSTVQWVSLGAYWTGEVYLLIFLGFLCRISILLINSCFKS
jgi:hypothetical protein